MEKKDALVKCSGCGTPYKLKIPVTDKPLRFQCKKCGKVLNIRIKAAPEQVPPPQPEESAPSDGLIPEFETTQLPDSMDDQEQATVAPVGRQPSFTDSADQSFPSAMVDRRWLVLSNEQVKGPFTDDEVSGMIKAGEIGPDTSLRMGQRPWIRANQVPWFRDLFGPDQQSSEAPRATERGRDREEPTGMPFYEELGKIVPYPLRAGNWQPLAIFLGIALVIFAALAFEFIIGLPLSIIGWTVLYGYLTVLMKASTESPGVPPPAWDFSNVKNLLGNGIKVPVGTSGLLHDSYGDILVAHDSFLPEWHGDDRICPHAHNGSNLCGHSLCRTGRPRDTGQNPISGIRSQSVSASSFDEKRRQALFDACRDIGCHRTCLHVRGPGGSILGRT